MTFLTILGSLLAGGLLWGWLSFRALRRRGKVGWAWAALGFALLQAGLLVFMVGSSRSLFGSWSETMPRVLNSWIFIWHLLFLPPWVIWTIAKGLSALAKKISGYQARETAPEPATGWSRRQFLTAATVFTPPLITGATALASENWLEQFRVRRLVVPIANLPAALDGLTIAQVSDVHVGRFTHGRLLERVVEETNRLEADVVALTGDLINDTLRAMPPALELARGLRAKQIVVACEGNHDLIEDPERFYREAEKGGLPLLRNDAATMTFRGQKVQFLGLPWDHTPRKTHESMQALLAHRDPAAWPILLAHHPHAWDDAGDIPLTLSGHTHGGQIMFNERAGFGSLFYRYWSGLYTRKQNALVVSNGVGNWFPVRVQAPAEILHLTLRPATAV